MLTQTSVAPVVRALLDAGADPSQAISALALAGAQLPLGSTQESLELWSGAKAIALAAHTSNEVAGLERAMSAP